MPGHCLQDEADGPLERVCITGSRAGEADARRKMINEAMNPETKNGSNQHMEKRSRQSGTPPASPMLPHRPPANPKARCSGMPSAGKRFRLSESESWSGRKLVANLATKSAAAEP